MQSAWEWACSHHEPVAAAWVLSFLLSTLLGSRRAALLRGAILGALLGPLGLLVLLASGRRPSAAGGASSGVPWFRSHHTRAGRLCVAIIAGPGQGVADDAVGADGAPRSARGWHGRGDELLAAGDDRGAHAAYAKALDLDPGHAFPWQGTRWRALGDYLRAEESLDGAVAAYSRALELRCDEPRHGDAHLGRGFARAEKGDQDGAIADLERFLLVVRTESNVANAEAARARSKLEELRAPRSTLALAVIEAALRGALASIPLALVAGAYAWAVLGQAPAADSSIAAGTSFACVVLSIAEVLAFRSATPTLARGALVLGALLAPFAGLVPWFVYLRWGADRPAWGSSSGDSDLRCALELTGPLLFLGPALAVGLVAGGIPRRGSSTRARWRRTLTVVAGFAIALAAFGAWILGGDAFATTWSPHLVALLTVPFALGCAIGALLQLGHAMARPAGRRARAWLAGRSRFLARGAPGRRPDRGAPGARGAPGGGTPMYRITRVGVASAARVGGVLGVFVGANVGVSLALHGRLAADAAAEPLGGTTLALLALAPIGVLGLGGLIVGALAAWLYNATAKHTGGLAVAATPEAP